VTTMLGQFLTVSDIGTFSGAVFAVTLIAQFLKGPVDRIWKIPSRYLVLIIAWALLLGRHYAIDGMLSPSTWYLDLLNGFLVALAAMGTHAMAKDHFDWK
jgi:hypothetical protein